MLRCILLSCLAQIGVSLTLSQPRIEAVEWPAAETKGPSGGFLQAGTSADDRQLAEQLKEQAKELQEELAQLPLDSQDSSQLSANISRSRPLDTAAFVQAVVSHGSQSKFAATKEDQEPDMEEEEDLEGANTGGSGLRVRPNAGKAPEVIEFGLFAKSFYGANMKANNFVIDLVITSQWKDTRVAQLLPEGMDELTLSKKESELKMWLPGIVVTNRDIGKYDLISTGVFIKRNGDVFKVERGTAVVKNTFNLEHFPFDRQDLVVKIASQKYMLKDVVLKPSKDNNGVKNGLLDGEVYNFVDWSTKAVQDVDGALKKSRGLFTITVDRNIDKYTQSHLIPGFLVMMISWGVFWFPFVAPFITPRLAMSILSLLTFTNLSLKSAAALPPGAPLNWNDIINRTIMTAMFFTVTLNIVAETCFHHLKIDDMAKSINHECKVVIPGVTIIGLILALSSAGHKGWMGVGTASNVINFFFLAAMGSYIAFTATRILSAMQRKKQEDAAKAANADKK